MSESVTLPALGESVTEGTVTRWLKSIGDTVEVDEPLLEVSTDKVDTEIPSPIAGVLEEILVQEDETVEIGAVLAKVGDGSATGGDAGGSDDSAAEAPAAESASAEAGEGESYADPAPEAETVAEPSNDAEVSPSEPAAPAAPEQPAAPPAPPQNTAPPAPPAPPAAPAAQTTEPATPAAPSAPPAPSAEAPSTSSHGGGGYVTPLVRKLANEHGVDLATVTGTGVGGRIRKEDVLAAAAPAEASAPAAPAVEVSPLRGTTVKMSRLRKVLAERAVASMQSTAQLTSVVEIDVTGVAQLRDRKKAEFLEKTGSKLSFLPFFAKAAVEALQAYPVVNATVDGDSIVYPETENLSIAVDTERGLLTPVVRNAASLSIAEIAAQIADLAARTRDNKLKPDELAGGTFTLTNTGSRGALFDTPVVFLPQVAILGTGIVVKKPVVVSTPGGEAIAIHSTVYFALSYDHRIVDGADAARYLTAVKKRLEAADFEADLGI